MVTERDKTEIEVTKALDTAPTIQTEDTGLGKAVRELAEQTKENK